MPSSMLLNNSTAGCCGPTVNPCDYILLSDGTSSWTVGAVDATHHYGTLTLNLKHATGSSAPIWYQTVTDQFNGSVSNSGGKVLDVSNPQGDIARAVAFLSWTTSLGLGSGTLTLYLTLTNSCCLKFRFTNIAMNGATTTLGGANTTIDGTCWPPVPCEEPQYDASTDVSAYQCFKLVNIASSTTIKALNSQQIKTFVSLKVDINRPVTDFTLTNHFVYPVYSQNGDFLACCWFYYNSSTQELCISMYLSNSITALDVLSGLPYGNAGLEISVGGVTSIEKYWSNPSCDFCRCKVFTNNGYISIESYYQTGMYGWTSTHTIYTHIGSGASSTIVLGTDPGRNLTENVSIPYNPGGVPSGIIYTGTISATNYTNLTVDLRVNIACCPSSFGVLKGTFNNITNNYLVPIMNWVYLSCDCEVTTGGLGGTIEITNNMGQKNLVVTALRWSSILGNDIMSISYIQPGTLPNTATTITKNIGTLLGRNAFVKFEWKPGTTSILTICTDYGVKMVFQLIEGSPLILPNNQYSNATCEDCYEVV